MKWYNILLYFACTIALSSAVQGPCPFAHDCSCLLFGVNPINAVASCNSSVIPTFMQTDIFITELQLNGNFTKIPSKSFYNLNTTIATLSFQQSGQDQEQFVFENGAFSMAENGRIENIYFVGYKYLTSLPEDLGENQWLTSLYIKGCGLQVIKSDTFNGTQLVSLTVQDNPLNAIELGAFNGIEDTLENLEFSNNDLSEIPNAIKDLTVLSYIKLTGSKITQIPSNVFPATTRAIDLSNNPLDTSTFTSNAFDGITSFLNLQLRNCGLTDVPVNLYGDSFKHLNVFDLSNNQINEITVDAFPVEYFRSMLNLPTLDNNPIQSIAVMAFSGFKKVYTASLINLYKLQTINFYLFSQMTSLGTISIENCRKLRAITLPDSVQLPLHLTSITVSYSDMILNLDANFGAWLSVSSNNRLTLQNNVFRCNDSLQWMHDYEYCLFHPQIEMNSSRCDDAASHIPLNEYIFKMNKAGHHCQ